MLNLRKNGGDRWLIYSGDSPQTLSHIMLLSFLRSSRKSFSRPVTHQLKRISESNMETEPVALFDEDSEVKKISCGRSHSAFLDTGARYSKESSHFQRFS